eukprot:TRINITY_DN2112_c0_g1_i4.p1 TRINITY_DN2112_c0_g1~~TRINITY_DN2112_c0_g1_i4.p1  ORF type:complete len:144 (-),score=15.61 TRINITY_DN2112_c0_g1_i4:101-532(-)
MASIISGLNNSAVAKLEKSWKKISQAKKDVFDYMTNIVAGRNNYAEYKDVMKNIGLPSIPFLVVILKDLTALLLSIPDLLEDGGCNFYKWRRMSEIIHDVISYQIIEYDIERDSDISHYLTKRIAEAADMGEEMLRKISNTKK